MFKVHGQKIAGIALVLVLGFVPVSFDVVHAADFSDLGGGGYSDSGDLGGGGYGDSVDLGGSGYGDSIDLGGTGYGDSLNDLGGTGYGDYGDLGGTGYGDYGDLGGTGYGDSLNDLGGGGYSPTVTDTVVGSQDVYGNAVSYQNGVGYSYENYSTPSYGSSYSQPYSQSYSQPFSSGSFGSAPASYYSAPVQQRPIVISQPVQQQQQQQQVAAAGQPINIVNTNTNTNTNVNTGTPAITTVTPIYTTPVQYPVQYVYPQTPVYQNYNYQTYQAPYCSISISNYGGYNYGNNGSQLATLTWSSGYGTSAYISPSVGSVSPSGSTTVYPISGQSYTMTVTGPGGSNTCVTAPTYIAQSSVSLSQIPYTGFDFGVFGDAMYWLALLAFAAAGGYLMVYYRGGMLSLAGATMTRKVQTSTKAVESAVTTTAKKIEKVAEPVRATLADLPVFQSHGTSDTMSLVHSKNNAAPRIVISRN